jgi:lipid A 3-O-deacylase
MKKILSSLAAAAALFAAQAGHAQSTGLVDSVSVEAGGGEHMQLVRFAAQKDWNQNWLPYGGYHLSGYWDANVAYWRANRWLDVPGNHKNLAVIGITPVFRWEADDKLGFYADAGIGAALFSSVYRNTHRPLSTADKWEVGARIQHYSNGGIKHPNGGVNLAVLKVAYHF